MRSIAFASALERCRGDGGRCPPSDRIDDALDLPRHLRSDRSPSSDFLSPLHDQAFCFLIYLGSPYTSTEFRPTKFVRDELPIPAQNCIGLGRCRHVLQCPSTQAVSDLGQCLPFSFRKQQPPLDLTSQDPDPVLRR